MCLILLQLIDYVTKHFIYSKMFPSALELQLQNNYKTTTKQLQNNYKTTTKQLQRVP